MTEALRAAEDMIGRAMDVAARIIRRGIVRITDDSYFQQIEGFSNPPDPPETFNGVELWQHFGLASRPPAGSEALLVKVDGDAEQPIAIVTQNRGERPSGLADGDTVLYGKSSGSNQASVKTRADLDVDLVPGAAEFVNVGGAKGDGALQAALLGKTAAEALKVFADAVAAAVDLAAVKTAGGVLATSLGVTGNNWKAARAKVK